MENPFFFDIFRAWESDAHAHGYQVVAATPIIKRATGPSTRLMIGWRVQAWRRSFPKWTPI